MTRYLVAYRWRSSRTWDTFTLHAQSQSDAEQLAHAYLEDFYIPDKLRRVQPVATR